MIRPKDRPARRTRWLPPSGALALACLLGACEPSTNEPADASALDGSGPAPADAAMPVDARGETSDARVDLDGEPPEHDGSVADGAATDDDAGATADAAVCDACCADGFARGDAGAETRLVARFTPSPEGVTVCPNGDLIVALDGNGELWRLPAAGGEPERWASVGTRQPAGVSCDARGRVFVAIYAVRSGTPTTPSLALISAAMAEPTLLPQPAPAAALQGLNGVVAVEGVGVYASDTGSQRIVLWQEEATGVFSARVVAENVPMPNGLAYAPATRTLYAATSLDQRVLSFAVASDGSLGAQTQALRGPDLVGFFDGVAVDAAGQLYAASFLAGRVVRGPTAVGVATVASPASLAFRGGTLFISDYKFGAPESEGGLYAVDLGVCGAGTLSPAAGPKTSATPARLTREARSAEGTAAAPGRVTCARCTTRRPTDHGRRARRTARSHARSATLVT